MATAYNSGSYQNIAYVFLGTKAAFSKDVKSLITTMKEMGNSLCDTSGDLLVLDTHVVAEVALLIQSAR